MPANLGPNFYPKLVEMASELGMRPEDLIAVMTSESGMNPSAHNPHGGASGLIQFMPNSLVGVGFHGTPAQFRELSGEQQLDWVKKMIKSNMSIQGGRPFTSGGHFYVSILWPIALKLPGVQKGDLSTVILEKNPQSVELPIDPKNPEKGFVAYSKKYLDVGAKIRASSEQAAYNGNPLFDKKSKGFITLGDLVNQVNLNRQNPVYKKTITDMTSTTGYHPGAATPTTAPDNKQENFMSTLDHYVKMLAASKSKKRLYKEALPNHNILITIGAPDHTSAVEFSRILCSALDEELLSYSYPHTDGQTVEIECSIPGPANECFEATRQLSNSVAEAFESATTKIGGIKIKIDCIMNKKSSYQPISLRMADTNFRKFLLKFI